MRGWCLERWRAADAKVPFQLLLPILVLLLWLFVNVALNFFNRWLLSESSCDFPYLVFVTFFQSFSTFCGGLVLIFVFDVSNASWDTFRANRLGIYILSVLHVLVLLCNNTALKFLSLSALEVVKACVPLATIIASLMFVREDNGTPTTFARTHVLTVLLLVLGCGMGVWTRPESSGLGLFLAIVAMLGMAFYLVSASVLLKAGVGGLDLLNLQWYASCVTAPIFLLVFLLSSEVHGVFPTLNERPVVFLAVLGNGLAAFLYNLAHFALIQATSPLTAAVANDLKMVLVVLISVLALDSSLATLNWLGIGLFVLAGSGYAYYAVQRRYRVPEPAPFVDAAALKGQAPASPATEKTSLVDLEGHAPPRSSGPSRCGCTLM